MASMSIAVAGATGRAAGQQLALDTAAPDEADVGELGGEGAVPGLVALEQLGVTLVPIHGAHDNSVR